MRERAPAAPTSENNRGHRAFASASSRQLVPYVSSLSRDVCAQRRGRSGGRTRRRRREFVRAWRVWPDGEAGGRKGGRSGGGKGDAGKWAAENGESIAGDCREVGDAGVDPTLRKSLLSEKLCVGQSITNPDILHCVNKIRILDSPT